MSADYKPGTVAYATVNGHSSYLVARSADGYWVSATKVDHRHRHEDEDVTDVRPLLTLYLGDTDPRYVWSQLMAAVEATGNSATSRTLRELADQIEAQTRPPKPAEPPGDWSVVMDADKVVWVRDARPVIGDMQWHSLETKPRCARYSGIDVVRVLSPGVES